MPRPCGNRTKTGEAVRGSTEALTRQWTDLIGLPLTRYDFKAFVSIFQARGEEHHVGERIRYIKVQVVICLDVITRIKVCRCLWSEGGVDGVEDKEIGMMSAKIPTHVPR